MNNLTNNTTLYQGNVEWNYINFRLQLLLSHPNIQIIKLIKNPNKNYLKKTYQLEIDSAIDITNYDQYKIDLLKQNTQNKAIFKCGRIQQVVQNYKNQKYRVLLFKIYINRIFPMYQTKNLTTNQILEKNNNYQYDSIYLSDHREQLNIFTHDYLLQSSEQYQWQYQVQYRYMNPEEQMEKIVWSSNLYQCQSCQLQKAKTYCIQQRQVLCNQCYLAQHRAPNKTKHSKQALDPFNCVKKCQKMNHNGQKLEYYCFHCKQLKCIFCKKDGIHKNTERNQDENNYRSEIEFLKLRKNQKHQIIDIRQLISKVKMKQNQLNKQIKQKLSLKLNQIEQNISKISERYTKELNKIKSQMKKDISILTDKSNKSLNQAVGLHIELKRKYDEILWMQKYAEYLQEIVDAKTNITVKQSIGTYLQELRLQHYIGNIDIKIKQLGL